ncbi:hypothetical protein DPMN_132347 [Dreissena polymorpha]|uniref:Uncharacterized protein n=1 Tax=Dreissena polymorpha TaxID=45954 RepID=A0A9D4FRE1_DREPO|nr:hypothetical protein DPMN_132347 [Dreissena polymorpha]
MTPAALILFAYGRILLTSRKSTKAMARYSNITLAKRRQLSNRESYLTKVHGNRDKRKGFNRRSGVF